MPVMPLITPRRAAKGGVDIAISVHLAGFMAILLGTALPGSRRPAGASINEDHPGGRGGSLTSP